MLGHFTPDGWEIFGLLLLSLFRQVGAWSGERQENIGTLEHWNIVPHTSSLSQCISLYWVSSCGASEFLLSRLQWYSDQTPTLHDCRHLLAIIKLHLPFNCCLITELVWAWKQTYFSHFPWSLICVTVSPELSAMFFMKSVHSLFSLSQFS